MIGKLFHYYLRVPYRLHVYRYSTVKRPRATLVFLHGIGNSGRTWDEVAALLPNDCNIIIVDLLGFGDSQKPNWAVYDARTQSRALLRTLLSLRVGKKVILVGHSMGGLVAIDFAKRYPAYVRSMILCSPPLYKVDPGDDKKFFAERDEQLRRLYEIAVSRPENIVLLSKFAKRTGLLNPDFDVDHMNVDSYVAALRSSILAQTSLVDILKIKKPTYIIYGSLDPFVIGDNIKKTAELSAYVSITRFVGGHEITGKYIKLVADQVKDIVNQNRLH